MNKDIKLKKSSSGDTLYLSLIHISATVTATPGSSRPGSRRQPSIRTLPSSSSPTCTAVSYTHLAVLRAAQLVRSQRLFKIGEAVFSVVEFFNGLEQGIGCLLYTSPARSAASESARAYSSENTVWLMPPTASAAAFCTPV